MKNYIRESYLRITLYYALFGLLWITLTDRLLFLVFPNPDQLIVWQTYKGWFFVIISTLFIYVMLATSARKRQESQNALVNSEKTYRLLFANNPLPMWVYDLETLAFLAVNEAAVNKYGYSREEFLSMSIRDIRPPEDVPRLLVDVAQTTNRLNFAGEWRHRRRDGTVFLVEITSHELVYNGRSSRLVIANDLTERKQAEAAAREKTEILEKVFDNVPVMLGLMNQNGRITLVNREFEQKLGWSLAEIQAYPDIFQEWYPDADYRAQVRASIQRGQGIFTEYRVHTRSGQALDTSFAYVLLSDGTSIGIGRDITHSKKIENELKESESRFRTAIEEAPFPIIIHAEDGEILSLSHIWTEITGYQLDEIPTIADWTERAYGIRQKQVQAGIDQLYELDRRVEEGEFQIKCKDGSQRIWDFSSTPLGPLPDGRRTVISVAVDVTKRKQAEEALRAKTEELDGYFKYSLDLLCIADINGRFRRLNKEWEVTLGYPVAELEGQRFLDFVHHDDLDATVAALSQLAGQQEVLNFVNRYRHKNGTYRWIEWRAIPADNLIYAAARDTTERIETEQQLRLQSAALEAAANGIVITDVAGNVEWVNSAFTKLTGYTAAEALGKNPRQLVRSGRHDKAFYEELWNTILDGRTWRGELINKRKDGTLYTEEEVITPVWDDQGHIAHFIAIKQDITRRKQAEIERSALLEQVKAQAKQLSQVMRTVPEGVLLLSQSNEILLANPRGHELLTQLAKVDAANKITHIGDTKLETVQTSPPAGQWHEVRTNGRVFEIIARPVETGPVPQGWVLVLRDITQQQEVQKQLQQQERLAAVGQLAAGIAHDFNNIMAVIVLYAQILERAPNLPAKQQQQLATIVQQAQQASKLIQQILDFSRRSVLDKQPLDFLSLLQKEISLLERTLPENIEIELVSQPDDYVLQADPTRLQQTIMNLAINARDAMPEGGSIHFNLNKIQIKNSKTAPFLGMAAGDWIELKITDTGYGIKPEIMKHIFEPFFTTKEPGKGTGLGLAQVHGIIGQHDGHIAIDSQEGVGTTFTIYLPTMTKNELFAVNNEVDVLPHGQGELLLIVEDQVALRKALVESLTMWSYQVLEASDGSEALAKLAEQGQDVKLIISDVIMPKMGGMALLQTIRSEGWNMPVILMTGHPLDAALSDLWAYGVHMTLTKPISPFLLAQAVASALDQA